MSVLMGLIVIGDEPAREFATPTDANGLGASAIANGHCCRSTAATICFAVATDSQNGSFSFQIPTTNCCIDMTSFFRIGS